MREHTRRRKAGRAAASVGVLLCLILAGGFLFGIPNLFDGSVKADAKSALEDLKEISGESRIESLADLKEAEKSEDPGTYLVENSVYVLDEEAVDRYVQSHIAGAESAALAQGVGVEELVVDGWGYESLETYKEEAQEEAHSFIKMRLAMYEAAKKYRIVIREKEYERLLQTYAGRYSFASAEEFTYACTPDSIADEMLYDKTAARICKRRAA